MSFTEDFYLPTEEELTVQEVNLSGPVLKAGAAHLGKSCEFVNNEFMLCRKETKDARACLDEGKAVTACSLKFFQQVKKSCYGEFMQYVNCLDKTSMDQSLQPCRKTQGVFDKCMVDNVGIERPPYDYFARVQIHKTNRPKPKIEERPTYPDATPYLPDDYERVPSKYGLRYMWE